MGSASSDTEQLRLISALAAVAKGRDSGLEELYGLTSAKLFGICLRICRNREAAEDVLNEVYLNVWRRAESYDPTRSKPMTWLCTVARNRSIDWVRSNGRPMESEDVLQTIPSGDKGADDRIVEQQERHRLHDCLEALRSEQRDAIRTAFYEGVSYSDLADRQKVPLGTMKTWVRRGLMKLKACLNGV